MSLRLVVVEGESLGAQLRLHQQSVVEVGRSQAADLRLPDAQVADIHLKVYREGERFTCFDVTGQGFLHNDKKTLKAALEVGDVIQLGSHKLRLLSDSITEVPSAPAAPAEPVATNGPALLAVKGNDAGKSWPLGHKNVHILGRGVSTDITIWDIRASRAHCRIDRGEGGGYRISDLNSSNGTTVNGRRITTHELVDGDEVRIGATVLRYCTAG
ncbi:MAG: FHA domain-containing protein [Planctomycetota bacterium]